MLKEHIKEFKISVEEFIKLLPSENEEEWDKRLLESLSSDSDYKSSDLFIHIFSEVIIIGDATDYEVTKFLVATYDHKNIKITIDSSWNHQRPHLHIGIKEDKYHSASIALDNGEVLDNTGNIPDWKVKKIIEWVLKNQPLLQKIWRCLNPWGDSESAEKRKTKLSDL